jgi:hypothetical protein
MRDFCVVVAAVIPLLLLNLSIEIEPRVAARARIISRTRRISNQRRDGAADVPPRSSYDPHVIADKDAKGAQVGLYIGLMAELIVLAVTPFMPDGSPERSWQWAILIGGLLFVAATMNVVVQVLKNGFRAELKAAADDLAGGQQSEGP